MVVSCSLFDPAAAGFCWPGYACCTSTVNPTRRLSYPFRHGVARSAGASRLAWALPPPHGLERLIWHELARACRRPPSRCKIVASLPGGVMVTQGILVPSFKVRILAG